MFLLVQTLFIYLQFSGLFYLGSNCIPIKIIESNIDLLSKLASLSNSWQTF